MKLAAAVWLAIVIAAAVLLAVEAIHGVKLQTDILALLPREERDPALQQAEDRAERLLAQRVLLLVGNADQTKALAAGSALAAALSDSGMAASVDFKLREDRLKALGALYYPYRAQLLNDADLARLENGRGEEIVNRALASVYQPGSIADMALLGHDPFMLLPSFLTALPILQSGLNYEDGVLTARDQGKNWVLVTVRLNQNVFDMGFQDRFIALLGRAEAQMRAADPGTEMLRAGAIFYAHDGAETANRESKWLSIVSLVGTIIVVVATFRALKPLLLTLLVIAVGVLCAFAATIFLFGGLHVAALLFGISLIGIALDYCLQYISSRFAAGSSAERLRFVLPGIALGAATTLIGYVTLLLAPFPGLRQVAIFSAIGLTASFATVVLWLPLLDKGATLRHCERILAAGDHLWAFWRARRYRLWRSAFSVVCVVLAVAGALVFTIDDDVRHQQGLEPTLRAQELALRKLVGATGGTEFVLVRAVDEEHALQTEEALSKALAAPKADGALGDFLAIAHFVPSAARQSADRTLIRDKLIAPYLDKFYQLLGIAGGAAYADTPDGFLTPSAIDPQSPIGFLRELAFPSDDGTVSHLLPLSGVVRGDEVRAAVASVPGARFVDPTGNLSRLLGDYRRRAVLLIAISAGLMFPVMLWRYGLAGAARASLPPIAAVILTPFIVALAGIAFNFFGAMALVLVLSIGFDYAVFCRESRVERRAATMLGVWLAAITTLLSFGVLGVSEVEAVRAFGATLTVGTLLAFAFAPIAANREAAA